MRTCSEWSFPCLSKCQINCEISARVGRVFPFHKSDKNVSQTIFRLSSYLAVRLQLNRWELTALSSTSQKPQDIFYQTSCIMQPKCQWWLICGPSGRNSLNTTPPTEGTYSQRRSMTASYFSSYHFYHPQGKRAVITSSIVGSLTLDSSALPLWALSCLSPFCPTLHPLDPRGKDPLSSLPLIYRALTRGGRSLIPSGWLCGYSGGWWGHGIAQRPPTAPPLGLIPPKKPYDSVSGKWLKAVLL